MSTLLVARKDFKDAIRSRTLLLVAGMFTAFLALLTYYKVSIATPGEPVEAAELYLPAASFVAVIGTLLGYNAIVGERESGSLKFLLGQPHTRRDIVIGKFLGRSAVVAVTVLVGFAVIGVHYGVLAESPSITAYAVLGGKTLVLGLVFVAIAVAFSAAPRSGSVATWGAIGLAVMFAFGWDSVNAIIGSILFPPESTPPNWFVLFGRLNPKYAFDGLSGQVPFYLEPWFAGVILGGWIVVPLGMAYLRFQRGDLA